MTDKRTHPDELPEGTVILYRGQPHELVKQDRYFSEISGSHELRQCIRPLGGGWVTHTILAMDPGYGGVER